MNRALPASLEQVRGLRAARWIRESTTGQEDNFGPDAQREQQDRAIARYGLVEQRLEWSVASSGWIRLADSRPGRRCSIGSGRRFRRPRRRLREPVPAQPQADPRRGRGPAPAAGVVVLFADERLSRPAIPSDWDQFVRRSPRGRGLQPQAQQTRPRGLRLEAPAARRARRQPGALRDRPRGQASTLAGRRGEGGRRPPRYELAAAGPTDWEVAAQTGLAKTHVAEILTNPIYAGRLRTGEPAGVAPHRRAALWSAVQTMRERRRTRTPGRIVKRNTPSACAARAVGDNCYGDVGRYRHPAPTCARSWPRRLTRGANEGRRHAGKGHSYPQDWYEAAVGVPSGRGRLGSTIAPSPRSSACHQAIGRRGPMSSALARIES